MAVTSYNPASALVLMGLAADTKPTDIAPGSRFLETDTGKIWVFYNTGSWVQVATISATAAPAITF
jgi:hypothetical protein